MLVAKSRLEPGFVASVLSLGAFTGSDQGLVIALAGFASSRRERFGVPQRS